MKKLYLSLILILVFASACSFNASTARKTEIDISQVKDLDLDDFFDDAEARIISEEDGSFTMVRNVEKETGKEFPEFYCQLLNVDRKSKVKELNTLEKGFLHQVRKLSTGDYLAAIDLEFEDEDVFTPYHSKLLRINNKGETSTISEFSHIKDFIEHNEHQYLAIANKPSGEKQGKSKLFSIDPETKQSKIILENDFDNIYSIRPYKDGYILSATMLDGKDALLYTKLNEENTWIIDKTIFKAELPELELIDQVRVDAGDIYFLLENFAEGGTSKIIHLNQNFEQRVIANNYLNIHISNKYIYLNESRVTKDSKRDIVRIEKSSLKKDSIIKKASEDSRFKIISESSNQLLLLNDGKVPKFTKPEIDLVIFKR